MNQKTDKNVIYIRCGETEFEFPISSREDAWYSLDHRESRNGKEKLVLNADRDVYAVYTDQDGTEHYGTIGDEENQLLSDNEGFCAGDRFVFYENPRTKEYYC